MCYLCPICQQPLTLHHASKGYYCDNKHHFDLAKEGYLNLLPVQHKKSSEPGDSRAMMRSRRHFLEAGFYLPLAKAIEEMIDHHLASESKPKILDVGCGEGYYCRQLEALNNNYDRIELHGIDIAKNAILAAAKKQHKAQFVVASSKKMPYVDNYFDLLLRVYAPANDKEIQRLLKTAGLLLLVTPGPRHLWQLKAFIYKQVKQHAVEIKLPDNFQQIDSQRIQFTIQPNQEQRMALLQMTPFAWRAKGLAQSTIQRATGLEIETDFILTLAKKGNYSPN